jgi:hypothetical protein
MAVDIQGQPKYRRSFASWRHQLQWAYVPTGDLQGKNILVTEPPASSAAGWPSGWLVNSARWSPAPAAAWIEPAAWPKPASGCAHSTSLIRTGQL